MDTSGIKGLATLCLLMVIGGIIGWFIAQMLVETSIRVFDHGWKGIGAMSLVFVVFLCAGEFDWFGYERNIPDPAEVKSVYFSAPGAATTTVELPESIQAVTALHQSIVDNKDVHELVAKNEGERKYLGLTYELKNGRSLYRNYPVDAGAEAYLDRDSDLWKLEAASNTPEGQTRAQRPQRRQAAESMVRIAGIWYRLSVYVGTVRPLGAVLRTAAPSRRRRGARVPGDDRPVRWLHGRGACA